MLRNSTWITTGNWENIYTQNNLSSGCEKKNDVAIFIIAIWQDVSFESQKFIYSLFIALNWIFAFFYIDEGEGI